MQQNSEYDKRVNGLLSGLEKIVQNIGDMRNINSDAHGVGSNRIRIREKEARLVMNSAISFCEYLLWITEHYDSLYVSVDLQLYSQYVSNFPKKQCA